MQLRMIRPPVLLAVCGMVAAGVSALGAGPAAAKRGVYPCFSEIPPLAGTPQWGFHTGPPITGKNGSYARAEGDVNLSAGSVNGTIARSTWPAAPSG